jgi:hypothetical protein
MLGIGFHSQGKKAVNGLSHTYGRPWGEGDVVGVGWDTRDNTFFFTLNGEHLGTAAAGTLGISFAIQTIVSR